LRATILTGLHDEQPGDDPELAAQAAALVGPELGHSAAALLATALGHGLLGLPKWVTTLEEASAKNYGNP